MLRLTADTPSRERGFTLIELLVVIGIIAVLLGILIPYLVDAPINARRARSATNLRGIGQTLYTYATMNANRYPQAGLYDPAKPAAGFNSAQRGQRDIKPDHADLANNITASLWVLVRQGHTTPPLYINPNTTDRADEMLDREGKVVPLGATWDFRWTDQGDKPLSYTTGNLYHPQRRRNYSSNTRPGWIIMSDDNNADGPNVHTHAFNDDADRETIELMENSLNERGDGQNCLYGDCSVVFEGTPFVGPSKNNIFARDEQTRVDGEEQPAPPTLGCDPDAHPMHQPKRDVMLLPLEGNNGVNLRAHGGKN